MPLHHQVSRRVLRGLDFIDSLKSRQSRPERPQAHSKDHPGEKQTDYTSPRKLRKKSSSPSIRPKTFKFDPTDLPPIAKDDISWPDSLTPSGSLPFAFDAPLPPIPDITNNKDVKTEESHGAQRNYSSIHRPSCDEQYHLGTSSPRLITSKVDLLAELLFSGPHLRAILDDSSQFLKFTAFLNRYNPQLAPILVRYLETSKAIKAIEYANAIAENVLSPTEDKNSYGPSIAASMDPRFEMRNFKSFEVLVSEALPGFITNKLVDIVTESLVKQITGLQAPVMRDLIGGLAETFCLTDPSRKDNPVVYASDGAQIDVTGLVEEGRGLDSFEKCLSYERGLRSSRIDSAHKHNSWSSAGSVHRSKRNSTHGRKQIQKLSELSHLFSFEEAAIVQSHSRRSSMQSDEHMGDGNAPLPPEWIHNSYNYNGNYRSSLSRGSRRILDPDATLAFENMQSSPFPNAESPVFTLGPSSRLPGVYQHYLLVRPYPSLRIIFVSPAMRIPGLLQSYFMQRIGDPDHVRERLKDAFEHGYAVTAKVNWLSNNILGRRDDSSTIANENDEESNDKNTKLGSRGKQIPRSKYSQDKHASDQHKPYRSGSFSRNNPFAPQVKPRWISCTPLCGSDDRVSVWMVVMVEREVVSGGLLSRQMSVGRMAGDVPARIAVAKKVVVGGNSQKDRGGGSLTAEIVSSSTSRGKADLIEKDDKVPAAPLDADFMKKLSRIEEEDDGKHPYRSYEDDTNTQLHKRQSALYSNPLTPPSQSCPVPLGVGDTLIAPPSSPNLSRMESIEEFSDNACDEEVPQEAQPHPEELTRSEPSKSPSPKLESTKNKPLEPKSSKPELFQPSSFRLPEISMLPPLHLEDDEFDLESGFSSMLEIDSLDNESQKDKQVNDDKDKECVSKAITRNHIRQSQVRPVTWLLTSESEFRYLSSSITESAPTDLEENTQVTETDATTEILNAAASSTEQITTISQVDETKEPLSDHEIDLSLEISSEDEDLDRSASIHITKPPRIPARSHESRISVSDIGEDELEQEQIDIQQDELSALPRFPNNRDTIMSTMSIPDFPFPPTSPVQDYHFGVNSFDAVESDDTVTTEPDNRPSLGMMIDDET
ncbi:MAG: hypothetical protein M1834_001833 [Cirrosporium novae-zelandiae]|nr:MAG: hypothetical protein M1834_001833 [Cirrosporium novae-zelandiae]